MFLAKNPEFSASFDDDRMTFEMKTQFSRFLISNKSLMKCWNSHCNRNSHRMACFLNVWFSLGPNHRSENLVFLLFKRESNEISTIVILFSNVRRSTWNLSLWSFVNLRRFACFRVRVFNKFQPRDIWYFLIFWELYSSEIRTYKNQKLMVQMSQNLDVLEFK